MTHDELTVVADLIRERNEIDRQVSEITQRPVSAGHVGEWIASQVFDIELEPSAVTKAIDGRFASGPLAGSTVNVKFYGKQEGLLDVSLERALDYYLVMTGPRSGAVSSRGGTRPLVIAAVYLFDAKALLETLQKRGVKIGVATSVRTHHWQEAEIFPRGDNPMLPLTDEQAELLGLFAGAVTGEAPSMNK